LTPSVHHAQCVHDDEIGANDLWIAAAALAYGMPVVTRNLEHYRRVPDLQVEAYRR
jgi:predicted nucleic acid-binding protein